MGVEDQNIALARASAFLMGVKKKPMSRASTFLMGEKKNTKFISRIFGASAQKNNPAYIILALGAPRASASTSLVRP